MTNYTVADVLRRLGAELLDVAQRIGEVPPGVQEAAAGVKVATITHRRRCVVS